MLDLYAAQHKAFCPALAEDAQNLYNALDDADKTRDEQEGDIEDARLDLADDRRAIARAQHRRTAQLELEFGGADKAYSFLDFSAARVNKSGKVKVVATTKAD